jgi:hypothetical protein
MKMTKGENTPVGLATRGPVFILDRPGPYTYNIRIRSEAMQKKLTITIDQEVYEGLHRTIGPRKISRFVEDLVRPHVVRPNLESEYAEMSKDKKREKEALTWAENTFRDTTHETR